MRYVELHERVDVRFGDGVHLLHQVANSPGVHLPAQFDLGLHLVALGDGHLPHVVAKAHHLQGSGHRRACGGAHPAAQPHMHALILPVAGDDLAGQAQPGGEKAVLPVAVGGLIEVHEVHVDLVAGDLPVILGGQVAIGLLQPRQAVNPHFAGGKGVAPGHHPGAGRAVVGLPHYAGNLPGGFGGHLIDQGEGQEPGQLLRHLPGPGVHRLQHLGAVQELAAHHKPEFIIFHDTRS